MSVGLLNFLQFAQGTAQVPVQGLVLNAQCYFQASFELIGSKASLEQLGPLAVSFSSQRFGAAHFAMTPRAACDADYARLAAAELANASYGMADLGRRCPSVWQVEAESAATRATVFYFGALLASVALGPLLPSDNRGLYGVRSARLYADKLLRTA